MVIEASDLPLCNVVFGLTLSFLSCTSSLFPTINKIRRLPATSIINLPWSVAAKCIALAAGIVHSMQWSEILAQNRDFCLLHLHLKPPHRGGGGFPSDYCHAIWYRKTRMAWLPDGEKILKIRLFWCNPRTRRTDRQTHRHRMTA